MDHGLSEPSKTVRNVVGGHLPQLGYHVKGCLSGVRRDCVRVCCFWKVI